MLGLEVNPTLTGYLHNPPLFEARDPSLKKSQLEPLIPLLFHAQHTQKQNNGEKNNKSNPKRVMKTRP